MNFKPLIWIGMIMLTIYAAIAVETPQYKIECTPEIALIQANGYHQTCTYQWKGDVNLTEDAAFCFGTTLNGAKVNYNGIDITSAFKYKHFNIDKGECYYVQNAVWIPNETKTLDIYYHPNDLTKIKWDTYFGNITAQRIDLVLDPQYNITVYEVGTQRSSIYQWRTMFPTMMINGDLKTNANNPYIGYTNISNRNDSTYAMNTGTTYTDDAITNAENAFDANVSTHADLFTNTGYPTYHTIGKIFDQPMYITTINISATWVGSTCPTYNKYNLNLSSYNGTDWNVEKVSAQCTLPQNWTLNKWVWGIAISDGGLGPRYSSNEIRLTEMAWNAQPSILKTTSYIESNQITLTAKIRQIQVNMTYNNQTGTASLKISNDGNLANGITLTDSNLSTKTTTYVFPTADNRLVYNISLLNSTTTIDSLTLNFPTLPNGTITVNAVEGITGTTNGYSALFISGTNYSYNQTGATSYQLPLQNYTVILYNDTYPSYCTYIADLETEGQNITLDTCTLYNAQINITGMMGTGPIYNPSATITDINNGWTNTTVGTAGKAIINFEKNRNYTITINNMVSNPINYTSTSATYQAVTIYGAYVNLAFTQNGTTSYKTIGAVHSETTAQQIVNVNNISISPSTDNLYEAMWAPTGGLFWWNYTQYYQWKMSDINSTTTVYLDTMRNPDMRIFIHVLDCTGTTVSGVKMQYYFGYPDNSSNVTNKYLGGQQYGDATGNMDFWIDSKSEVTLKLSATGYSTKDYLIRPTDYDIHTDPTNRAQICIDNTGYSLLNQGTYISIQNGYNTENTITGNVFSYKADQVTYHTSYDTNEKAAISTGLYQWQIILNKNTDYVDQSNIYLYTNYIRDGITYTGDNATIIYYGNMTVIWNPTEVNQNTSGTPINDTFKNILLLIGLVLVSLLGQKFIKTEAKPNNAGFHVYMLGLIVSAIISTAFIVPAVLSAFYYGVRGVMKAIGE